MSGPVLDPDLLKAFVAVADDTTVESRGGERYGQSFAVITPSDRYELSLPVLGEFQQENAATAIRALEMLDDALRPTRVQIEAGFSRLVSSRQLWCSRSLRARISSP